MPRYSAAAALLILHLTVSSVQGFAPVSNTGTKVQTIPSSSFTGNQDATQPITTPPSSTALAAGFNPDNLLDRFVRVTKANINNALKNLEDPEKVMTQALKDMQSDLIKIKQSYSEITGMQRRMLKQKEHAEAIATDWHQRAQVALKWGNEGLAREALMKRAQALEQGDAFTKQIEVQAASMNKLYEGMKTLETKIMETKEKKYQLAARARTAKTTITVNNMLSDKVSSVLGGLAVSTSMEAMKRMEEKVEALEATAEASGEMNTFKALESSKGGTVEETFQSLELEAAVEDELKKLKGALPPASTVSGRSIPNRNIPIETGPGVSYKYMKSLQSL